MATYSVADAKSGLPKLIDRALQGDEVIISRHGKAVAELRALAAGAHGAAPASYAWLKARRQGRTAVDVTSVELLNELYNE